MHLSDRVTGLFLVALGGVAAYGGSRLPPVPGQQIGPEVFPMVVGLSLALCGGLIALGVGRRYEDEADVAMVSTPVEGTSASTDLLPSRWRELRVLIPPALLIFYVYVVEALGFLPTAAAIVLVTALALGARLRLAIPVAIVAPLAINLLFLKLLRVPLPSGLLPLPWIGLP
jgi:putative tricarboxylic transport membrane protein